MNKKTKSKIFIVIIIGILSALLIISIRYIGIDNNKIYLKTETNELIEQNHEEKLKDKYTITHNDDTGNDTYSTTIINEINNGNDFIYSSDYNVALPVYKNIEPEDTSKQNKLLNTGAISYSLYGEAGKGNYDIFAHHGFNDGSYFTSFINNLKKGDEVYVLTKEKDQIKKYTYIIDYSFEVDKDDTDTVYYESNEPIITIGTCKLPYKTEYRIIWQGHLKVDDNK